MALFPMTWGLWVYSGLPLILLKFVRICYWTHLGVVGFDVCLMVWQCIAISHRYLRWLTGGGGHFLALLSKLGVVSCPLSQECVETVSIVPELVFIVCYFIRQRGGIEKGGGLGTHKTGLTPPWSSACIKSGYCKNIGVFFCHLQFIYRYFKSPRNLP